MPFAAEKPEMLKLLIDAGANIDDTTGACASFCANDMSPEVVSSCVYCSGLIR